MMEYTIDNILNMIYTLQPRDRKEAIFLCGKQDFYAIRQLVDDKTKQPAVQLRPERPMAYTLFGFPIYTDSSYAGLAFGPFSRSGLE